MSQLRKYDFIDALRGWAIIGVVMVHASLMAQPSSPLLATIAGQGQRGVQLFFVASALTLFLSLRGRGRQETRPIRNYFIRRFFRIAPLFYVAIVFFSLVNGIDFAEDWWQVAATAAFLQGWHPESINSVVPGGWTIAVEMTFYLCVPFLFRIVTTAARAVLFILFSVVLSKLLGDIARDLLALLGNDLSQKSVDLFLFFWFFSQLPVFGFGILAFHWFSAAAELQQRTTGWVLLLTFFLLAFAFLDVRTFINILPQHVLYAGAFTCLAIALYLSRPWLLVNPLIVSIGRVSFSIYLVHFALMKVPHLSLHNTFSLTGDAGFFVVFPVLLTSAYLISLVTYRLIERPGIALGESLIASLDRRDRRCSVTAPA